ncbi:MAG: glutamyl-tRNA amidotransferase subunit C, aspartyl-tRNA(Asn)/glutamyl-tRNA (Gln) amidotransferase subunit C [Candidatus Peregrinibacteria bacterium GW2011_GWE2_39_6]|nr:MAG: glutamyl-tRNA amidotransferase subunit C, aspartyl-tRNA(Asn)/glutamyl-tRNA (Gln) amidotransferase subunit C [Candidatus Peregrinibacteria bacterium GW2011_GWF2_39_17]KKR25963.1 MAG: glutamyl-tRNA amidotransferase subunit C, aspartyl-tRNA(Asn)/glutamyl-tRNA (Gln) amidotransferase subunit C [Candidatus Peregrinibacteria bacterium GW2011_GWE2_39_6]HCW32458.1 Asp-tRNA(Asn)/Glu-tRNA(Gln) amidotransferase GatCAB subunit C [Candidatus Peregrinibacteria bacterium]
MSLSGDQVRHVAKLARLALSEVEVVKFSKQLSAVLDYMAILNEVDTEGVAPTSQVTGLKNVDRVDEIKFLGCEPNDLLKCSPLPVQDDQIKVKSVF